jgi:hypothetical protein
LVVQQVSTGRRVEFILFEIRVFTEGAPLAPKMAANLVLPTTDYRTVPVVDTN